MKEEYIFGRNPVIELLKSDKTVDKLYVQKGDLRGSIVRILSLAREKNIIVQRVEKEKLDSLSSGGTHQGVVAFTTSYEYKTLEDAFKSAEERKEDPFFVILDKIEDTHNLGAVIRTAECAGVHGVIIPKRRSAMVNRTVYKVSAGAVDFVNVIHVNNLTRTVEDLKKRGVWVYGLVPGSDVKHYQNNLKGPICLVIGSEGNGISRLLGENLDGIVSIEMKGKINSLNASNAAAIAMYEVLRQRDE